MPKAAAKKIAPSVPKEMPKADNANKTASPAPKGAKADMPSSALKAKPAKQPEAKKRLSTWMKIGIAAIIAFILFVVYFATQPIGVPEVSVWQEELSPNAELRLAQGENYSYQYLSDGKNLANVTHRIMETDGGCTRIVTDATGYAFSSCIDTKTGFLRQLRAGEASPVNATLDFAQPWMLSLKQGWTWRVETNVTLYSAEMGERTAVKYRVASTEPVMNRSAFRVEVEATSVIFSSSGESEPSVEKQTIWVDSEKRVLLRAVDGENEIALVSAPFALGK